MNYAGDAEQLLATIDEPAIYAYALTPGQVYTHWLAGLGPLGPPPTVIINNDSEDYWEVRIYNTEASWSNVPKADIDSLSLLDSLNGGSSTSTLSFVRDYNAIGKAQYLFSVLVWIWNGRIARPSDLTWAGYIRPDIDDEMTRTLGKVDVAPRRRCTHSSIAHRSTKT